MFIGLLAIRNIVLLVSSYNIKIQGQKYQTFSLGLTFKVYAQDKPNSAPAIIGEKVEEVHAKVGAPLEIPCTFNTDLVSGSLHTEWLFRHNSSDSWKKKEPVSVKYSIFS